MDNISMGNIITAVIFFSFIAAQEVSVYSGVIDGDTFETSNGRVVRVLNINTPELGTEAGKRAYYYARKLLNKKKITLVGEGKERGKYGRYLYHVILPDGSLFAQRMIRRGHSRYYIKYGKSKLFGEIFEEAEKEAKKKRLGMWKKLRSVE